MATMMSMDVQPAQMMQTQSFLEAIEEARNSATSSNDTDDEDAHSPPATRPQSAALTGSKRRAGGGGRRGQTVVKRRRGGDADDGIINFDSGNSNVVGVSPLTGSKRKGGAGGGGGKTDTKKKKKRRRTQKTTPHEDWYTGFLRFKSFQARFGDASVYVNKELVPNGYHQESEFDVVSWVNKQRFSYLAGALSADRLALLDSVGMNFTFCAQPSYLFSVMYRRLIEYKHRTGNVRVPKTFIDGPYLLGKWCDEQHRKGKADLLSPHEKSSLAFLNFFRHRAASSAQWDATFEKWKACTVSGARLPPYLLSWGYTQRKRFKTHRLSVQQVHRLNEAGFSWSIYNKSPWLVMFRRLKAFYEQFGPDHAAPDRKLRVWCNLQRVYNKKGKLPADRRSLLDSIGFEWVLHKPHKAAPAAASASASAADEFDSGDDDDDDYSDSGSDSGVSKVMPLQPVVSP